MKKNRLQIMWLEWDDKPPYVHLKVACLTWTQYQRYCQIRERESLSKAYDYAERVSVL